jgi:hypothetical protein
MKGWKGEITRDAKTEPAGASPQYQPYYSKQKYTLGMIALRGSLPLKCEVAKVDRKIADENEVRCTCCLPFCNSNCSPLNQCDAKFGTICFTFGATKDKLQEVALCLSIFALVSDRCVSNNQSDERTNQETSTNSIGGW